MQPSADFAGLVASLAAGAATALTQLQTGAAPGAPKAEGEQEPVSPEEQAERRRVGLETARHLIDMLGMLEQKTKGNLSNDEQELLQSVLAELRIQYAKTVPPSRQP